MDFIFDGSGILGGESISKMKTKDRFSMLISRFKIRFHLNRAGQKIYVKNMKIFNSLEKNLDLNHKCHSEDFLERILVIEILKCIEIAYLLISKN